MGILKSIAELLCGGQEVEQIKKNVENTECSDIKVDELSRELRMEYNKLYKKYKHNFYTIDRNSHFEVNIEDEAELLYTYVVALHRGGQRVSNSEITDTWLPKVLMADYGFTDDILGWDRHSYQLAKNGMSDAHEFLIEVENMIRLYVHKGEIRCSDELVVDIVLSELRSSLKIND